MRSTTLNDQRSCGHSRHAPTWVANFTQNPRWTSPGASHLPTHPCCGRPATHLAAADQTVDRASTGSSKTNRACCATWGCAVSSIATAATSKTTPTTAGLATAVVLNIGTEHLEHRVSEPEMIKQDLDEELRLVCIHCKRSIVQGDFFVEVQQFHESDANHKLACHAGCLQHLPLSKNRGWPGAREMKSFSRDDLLSDMRRDE